MKLKCNIGRVNSLHFLYPNFFPLLKYKTHYNYVLLIKNLQCNQWGKTIVNMLHFIVI